MSVAYHKGVRTFKSKMSTRLRILLWAFMLDQVISTYGSIYMDR